MNGKEYPISVKISRRSSIRAKGMWFDFTTNKGGGLKELMKKIEIANRAQAVSTTSSSFAPPTSRCGHWTGFGKGICCAARRS